MDLYTHRHKLTEADTRAYDFDRDDGLKVELKSDQYDMDKTPNFFIERFSDVSKESPGSLWQSYEKGVDVFIYYFAVNGIYFEFEGRDKIKLAIERVEEYIAKGAKPTYIANIGFTALGYKVPRSLFADLYKEFKFDANV